MSEFEINGTPVHKLRVVDLKEELDARGLSKSGKKDELVARLVSFLEAEAKNEEKTEEVEDGSNDSKDEMMKKWQEEREQLLKENEVKRLEEEKTKEEEERKKQEEEKTKQEEERKKQEDERKRLEDEKMKEKEKAEKAAEAARLKEEEERKLAEELRLKEEAKKKAEEEKKLAAEKKAEEKRKIAEEKKKAEDKKKAEEEEKALLKKREKDELEAKELKRREREKLEEDELRKSEEEKLNKSQKESSEKEAKLKGDDSAPVDNNKEDESLILETAADDTLVMEIEQADIVTDDKEEQEKAEIPSEPGQVTSLRRLGSRSGAGADDRKRGWGASKVTNGGALGLNGAAPVSISSDSLKDIVPDLKPLLDTTEPAISDDQGEIQSVDSDPDVAGPKVPDSVKNEKDEPVKKKKRIVLTEDDNESEFIIITQLTRPFTVKAFQEMLKRTGTLEDFWIDKIKSTCIVKFSSSDQASETKMALDGVTWPVGNPRTLRVAFSTQEMMDKYKQNAEVGLKSSGDAGDRLSGLREWDKNKSDEREERRGDHERERRNDREVRIRERSRERPPPTKSLEELFQKTTANPAIYWKPLTEEQIQQKIEARKKKLMEAKILKEMEDTKETLQKSQKLISSRSPP